MHQTLVNPRSGRKVRSMPNFRSGPAIASGPIVAEGATLPTIRAAGFEIRANAYVVGRTRRIAGGSSASSTASSRAMGVTGDRYDRSPGCQGGVTDVWYLSLVGARGQGTSLRAVWANLVSNHNRAVWLEGIGSVTLGHNRFDLTNLGYPIHWTYRQAVIPPSRDVQGVLESDLLTCHDPLLVPNASRGRTRRAAGKQKGGGRLVSGGSATPTERAGGKTEGAAVTLTSAVSGAERTEEAAAREAHPLFLLLVPSTRDGEEVNGTTSDEWLARLHLRYLATRIPWLPYYPAWASYLWQRARERGEAEALHVWCYRDPGTELHPATFVGGSSVPVQGGHGTGPYLSAAYLCRPDPLRLTTDLSRAIATGRFDVAQSAPSKAA